MAGKLVVTIGAVLRGDDAAGPYLAKLLEDDSIEGWGVVDGGQMPEDELSAIRRVHPDLLVLVDAAQMGLEPGAVRVLERTDVVTGYLMTTHSLPISFLLDELEGCCGELAFLGVQPAQTDFFAPLTPAVLQAVEGIRDAIAEGDLSRFQRLG